MPAKRSILTLIVVALPLFLGFSSAEETHGSPLTEILGKTLNFLILFGGLGFLLAKPLRKFLEEAGLAVEKTIQKTRLAREEAEQRLEALKERMEGLESEVRKLKEAGREAGQQNGERLLAQARQEIDKVRSLAELEIKMYAQAAQAELREYAAELAVSLAETNIKRRMTPELHVRMIDDSIRQLEKLYEKAHSG